MRRERHCSVYFATAVLALAGTVAWMSMPVPAAAEVIFEGDGDPTDFGWEFNENIGPVGGDNGGWWFFNSPTGSIRLITTQSGQSAGGSWYQPPQAVEDAELVRANGWRVEFSAQPQQYIGSGGSSIQVGDDLGLFDVQLKTTEFVFTGINTTNTPLSVSVDTARQWPVELVLAPGGTAVEVTVAGAVEGSVLIDQSSRTPTLIIGDLASAGRGETIFDYWRLNPEVTITTNLVEDAFALSFDSDTNATYELQFSELPQSNQWTRTGAFVDGDGGTLQMFDPTGSSTSKIYRILRL